MPRIRLPNLGGIPRPFPRFGELLRDHRTLRGMSVEQLAEAVQVGPGALREIEAGSRPAPPEEIVKALAGALSLKGEDRETFVDAAEWDSLQMGALLGRKPARPETPPLRAAILVFLLADIRGYTRFTQERGDRAAAQLTTRLADLARTLAERWDGQFVEARGDEVLLAFASAERALHAARALQERCRDETQAHPELPLPIGIGLDLGEAVALDGGGYRGAALNRAARLCSLAGPGEVLVSSGVVYVAPHVDGVTYLPRGQEQLKGFAGPVPVLLAAPSPVVEAGVMAPDEREPDEAAAPDEVTPDEGGVARDE
jgi:adenylate cyclase